MTQDLLYEVPLYWTNGAFHVPAPDDLGVGWASETALLQEAAMGYPVAEITAADLPAPLDNPTYAGLRLFRLEGQSGPSYFGIAAIGR
jgi:hypothetical protein